VSEETFRWVIAVGVIVVAVFFAVMGIASFAIMMYTKRLMERLEPILASAKPIAQHAAEVAAAVKPRILKVSADVTKVSGDVARIAGDAVEVSSLVVTEAKRYSELSKDVGARAKVKIARFDEAVDETVEQVQEASGAVKNAVKRPFQQLDGVMAGLRSAIHTYANGGSRNNMYGSSQYRAAQDEEMFI